MHSDQDRFLLKAHCLFPNSISSGKMFESETRKAAVKNVLDNNSTMHFLGLFSDGNVHSNIEHLRSMIEHAKKDGIGRVRIHILLDGRDVGETTALEYIDPFEDFLKELRSDNFDICIASGGGRMKITMDRYEADWSMVERGWHTHVLGDARRFASASEAVKTLRDETHAIDQDIDPFVIEKDGSPVGTIENGDTVIFYNFRGDRSLEISRAFESGQDFDKFERIRVPKVYYAGMLEYDGDLHIPEHYLVNPPEITNTLRRIPCRNRYQSALLYQKHRNTVMSLISGTETNPESSPRSLKHTLKFQAI